jgi:hemoglobin-like flavoprotein
MTPQQVAAVRASFALVEPIADKAAALFYDYLFRLDPALRSLFRRDMSEQGKLLLQMIGAAVRLLDHPQRLLPALHALGARHAGYGVRDTHYATVGAALLQTLQQGLGDAFTPEVREAWIAMYEIAAVEMQRGAMRQAA